MEAISESDETTGVSSMRTHRLENLRSIVINRILAGPLLEYKDSDGNDESDSVAFSEKGLLEPQAFPSFSLFGDSSLNLCHLVSNQLVVNGQPT